MQWIRKGWNGEYSLGKIFWLFGILYPLLVGFAGGFVIGFLMAIVSGGAPNAAGLLRMQQLFQLLAVPYTIWWGVATWRSAAMASKFWGVLAKIVVVLAIIGMPFQIYGSFQPLPPTLLEQSPQARCEEQMRAHAKENGADPERYMADNQAYLQECINYYTSLNARKAPNE
jgi:hypothetical protein